MQTEGGVRHSSAAGPTQLLRKSGVDTLQLLQINPTDYSGNS